MSGMFNKRLIPGIVMEPSSSPAAGDEEGDEADSLVRGAGGAGGDSSDGLNSPGSTTGGSRLAEGLLGESVDSPSLPLSPR